MIAQYKLNKARRMIENQHLATSAANKLPIASKERNNLLLLALYSNLVANELVATQDSIPHEQI